MGSSTGGAGTGAGIDVVVATWEVVGTDDGTSLRLDETGGTVGTGSIVDGGMTVVSIIVDN